MSCTTCNGGAAVYTYPSVSQVTGWYDQHKISLADCPESLSDLPEGLHIVVLDSCGKTLYDNYEVDGIDYSCDIPIQELECDQPYKDVKHVGGKKIIKIAYKEKKKRGDCCKDKKKRCKKCSDYIYVIISTEDKRSYRLIAWERINEFARGIRENTPTVNAAQLAECATFCSPGGCITGRANALAAFQGYVNSGVERNQFVIIRSFAFDEINREGVVEWTWNATRTEDNVSYQQDDAIVFKLDRAGFFCYFREYFDPAQLVSNYSGPSALCCNSCRTGVTPVMNGGNEMPALVQQYIQSGLYGKKVPTITQVKDIRP